MADPSIEDHVPDELPPPPVEQAVDAQLAVAAAPEQIVDEADIVMVQRPSESQDDLPQSDNSLPQPVDDIPQTRPIQQDIQVHQPEIVHPQPSPKQLPNFHEQDVDRSTPATEALPPVPESDSSNDVLMNDVSSSNISQDASIFGIVVADQPVPTKQVIVDAISPSHTVAIQNIPAGFNTSFNYARASAPAVMDNRVTSNNVSKPPLPKTPSLNDNSSVVQQGGHSHQNLPPNISSSSVPPHFIDDNESVSSTPTYPVVSAAPSYVSMVSQGNDVSASVSGAGMVSRPPISQSRPLSQTAQSKSPHVPPIGAITKSQNAVNTARQPTNQARFHVKQIVECKDLKTSPLKWCQAVITYISPDGNSCEIRWLDRQTRQIEHVGVARLREQGVSSAVNQVQPSRGGNLQAVSPPTSQESRSLSGLFAGAFDGVRNLLSSGPAPKPSSFASIFESLMTVYERSATSTEVFQHAEKVRLFRIQQRDAVLAPVDVLETMVADLDIAAIELHGQMRTTIDNWRRHDINFRTTSPSLLLTIDVVLTMAAACELRGTRPEQERTDRLSSLSRGHNQLMVALMDLDDHALHNIVDLAYDGKQLIPMLTDICLATWLLWANLRDVSVDRRQRVLSWLPLPLIRRLSQAGVAHSFGSLDQLLLSSMPHQLEQQSLASTSAFSSVLYDFQMQPILAQSPPIWTVLSASGIVTCMKERLLFAGDPVLERRAWVGLLNAFNVPRLFTAPPPPAPLLQQCATLISCVLARGITESWTDLDNAVRTFMDNQAAPNAVVQFLPIQLIFKSLFNQFSPIPPSNGQRVVSVGKVYVRDFIDKCDVVIRLSAHPSFTSLNNGWTNVSAVVLVQQRFVGVCKTNLTIALDLIRLSVDMKSASTTKQMPNWLDTATLTTAATAVLEGQSTNGMTADRGLQPWTDVFSSLERWSASCDAQGMNALVSDLNTLVALVVNDVVPKRLKDLTSCWRTVFDLSQILSSPLCHTLTGNQLQCLFTLSRSLCDFNYAERVRPLVNSQEFHYLEFGKRMTLLHDTLPTTAGAELLSIVCMCLVCPSDNFQSIPVPQFWSQVKKWSLSNNSVVSFWNHVIKSGFRKHYVASLPKGLFDGDHPRVWPGGDYTLPLLWYRDVTMLQHECETLQDEAQRWLIDVESEGVLSLEDMQNDAMSNNIVYIASIAGRPTQVRWLESQILEFQTLVARLEEAQVMSSLLLHYDVANIQAIHKHLSDFLLSPSARPLRDAREAFEHCRRFLKPHLKLLKAAINKKLSSGANNGFFSHHIDIKFSLITGQRSVDQFDTVCQDVLSDALNFVVLNTAQQLNLGMIRRLMLSLDWTPQRWLEEIECIFQLFVDRDNQMLIPPALTVRARTLQTQDLHSVTTLYQHFIDFSMLLTSTSTLINLCRIFEWSESLPYNERLQHQLSNYSDDVLATKTLQQCQSMSTTLQSSLFGRALDAPSLARLGVFHEVENCDRLVRLLKQQKLTTEQTLGERRAYSTAIIEGSDEKRHLIERLSPLMDQSWPLLELLLPVDRNIPRLVVQVLEDPRLSSREVCVALQQLARHTGFIQEWLTISSAHETSNSRMNYIRVANTKIQLEYVWKGTAIEVDIRLEYLNTAANLKSVITSERLRQMRLEFAFSSSTEQQYASNIQWIESLLRYTSCIGQLIEAAHPDFDPSKHHGTELTGDVSQEDLNLLIEEAQTKLQLWHAAILQQREKRKTMNLFTMSQLSHLINADHSEHVSIIQHMLQLCFYVPTIQSGEINRLLGTHRHHINDSDPVVRLEAFTAVLDDATKAMPSSISVTDWSANQLNNENALDPESPAQRVVTATGFGADELVRLMISVYHHTVKRLPLASEFLWCSSCTTLEQLALFLVRACQHKDRLFMLMECNQLAGSVHDQLLNFVSQQTLLEAEEQQEKMKEELKDNPSEQDEWNGDPGEMDIQSNFELPASHQPHRPTHCFEFPDSVIPDSVLDDNSHKPENVYDPNQLLISTGPRAKPEQSISNAVSSLVSLHCGKLMSNLLLVQSTIGGRLIPANPALKAIIIDTQTQDHPWLKPVHSLLSHDFKLGVLPGLRANLDVVSSRAADGKSYYIAQKLGSSFERCHLHDTVNRSHICSAVRRAASECSGRLWIDVSGYSPAMEVHRILVELLLFGMVSDELTGELASLSVLQQGADDWVWQIYIELPSYGPRAERYDKELEQFFYSRDWTIDELIEDHFTNVLTDSHPKRMALDTLANLQPLLQTHHAQTICSKTRQIQAAVVFDSFEFHRRFICQQLKLPILCYATHPNYRNTLRVPDGQARYRTFISPAFHADDEGSRSDTRCSIVVPFEPRDRVDEHLQSLAALTTYSEKDIEEQPMYALETNPGDYMVFAMLLARKTEFNAFIGNKKELIIDMIPWGDCSKHTNTAKRCMIDTCPNKNTFTCPLHSEGSNCEHHNCAKRWFSYRTVCELLHRSSDIDFGLSDWNAVPKPPLAICQDELNNILRHDPRLSTKLHVRMFLSAIVYRLLYLSSDDFYKEQHYHTFGLTQVHGYGTEVFDQVMTEASLVCDDTARSSCLEQPCEWFLYNQRAIHDPEQPSVDDPEPFDMGMSLKRLKHTSVTDDAIRAEQHRSGITDICLTSERPKSSYQLLAAVFGLSPDVVKQVLDEDNYVLSDQYTKKFLQIMDNFRSSILNILTGETGVGKTYLLRQIAKLINHKDKMFPKLELRNELQRHLLPDADCWFEDQYVEWVNMYHLTYGNKEPTYSEVTEKIRALLSDLITAQPTPDASPLLHSQDGPLLLLPPLQLDGDGLDMPVDSPSAQFVLRLFVALRDIRRKYPLLRLSNKTNQFLNDPNNVDVQRIRIVSEDDDWTADPSNSVAVPVDEVEFDTASLMGPNIAVLLQAFEEVSARQCVDLFHRVGLHGSISPHHLFDQRLRRIVQQAIQHPDRTVLLFLDEANTISYPAYLETLLSECRHYAATASPAAEGHESRHANNLPPNLYLIAAINPLKDDTSLVNTQDIWNQEIAKGNHSANHQNQPHRPVELSTECFWMTPSEIDQDNDYQKVASHVRIYCDDGSVERFMVHISDASSHAPRVCWPLAECTLNQGCRRGLFLSNRWQCELLSMSEAEQRHTETTCFSLIHRLEGSKVESVEIILRAEDSFSSHFIFQLSTRLLSNQAVQERQQSIYSVRDLSPSLQYRQWVFAQPDPKQLAQYIQWKLVRLPGDPIPPRISELFAQHLLRIHQSVSSDRGPNSVSQRDILRTLALFVYFRYGFEAAVDSCKEAGCKKCNEYRVSYPREADDRRNAHYSNSTLRRAFLLSVFVAYIVRLPPAQRLAYDSDLLGGARSDEKCTENTMALMLHHLKIPSGISINTAVSENIFALMVCLVTRIPLIIIGLPGSSKTLSYTLVASNLSSLSNRSEFLLTFPALETHRYQCSPHSTSADIDDICNAAKRGQRSANEAARFDAEAAAKVAVRRVEHAGGYKYQFLFPSKLHVVFMDEAGLTLSSRRNPLKALHYHLDQPVLIIGYVAITNQCLDPARMNRAINVWRAQPTVDDLKAVSRACLMNLAWRPQSPSNTTMDVRANQRLGQLADGFAQAYYTCTSWDWFTRVYGLRDFYHFLRFFNRHMSDDISLAFQPQTLVEALQRNFSGVTDARLESIRQVFEANVQVGSEMSNRIPFKSFVSIFKSSLHDQHRQLQNINDTNVRFKLVIDHSADHSFTRMLSYIKATKVPSDIADEDFFRDEVLGGEKGRPLFFHGSGFENDERHQLKLMNAFQPPLAKGKCIFLIEIESIHDCLYDLFNQYLLSVGQADLFYSYLALKAINKPINVHVDAQIVLVVHSSLLPHTPVPLLNRFEKFSVDVVQLWATFKCAWKQQPHTATLSAELDAVQEKVEEFAQLIHKGLMGYVAETVSSLMLGVLRCHPSSDIDSTNLLSYFEFPNHITQQHNKAVEQQIFKSPLTSGSIVVERLCLMLVALAVPEVLILYRNAITPYVFCYSNYQNHWSLEAWIRSQQPEPFQQTAPHLVAQKSVLFARTTHELLHALSKFTHNEPMRLQTRERVLYIQLSQLKSGLDIEGCVSRFLSGNDDILFVNISIRDVKLHAVHQIRFELDQQLKDDRFRDKRIILCIHFAVSSTQRLQSYPALFLDGWSFEYMDSLFQSTIESTALHGAVQQIVRTSLNFATTQPASPRRNLTGVTNATFNSSLLLSVLRLQVQIPSQATGGSCPMLLHSETAMQKPGKLARVQQALKVELNGNSLLSCIKAQFTQLWHSTLSSSTSLLESACRSLLNGQSTLSVTEHMQQAFEAGCSAFILSELRLLSAGMNLEILLHAIHLNPPQQQNSPLIVSTMFALYQHMHSFLKYMSVTVEDVVKLAEEQGGGVTRFATVPLFPFSAAMRSLIQRAVDEKIGGLLRQQRKADAASASVINRLSLLDPVLKELAKSPFYDKQLAPFLQPTDQHESTLLLAWETDQAVYILSKFRVDSSRFGWSAHQVKYVRFWMNRMRDQVHAEWGGLRQWSLVDVMVVDCLIMEQYQDQLQAFLTSLQPLAVIDSLVNSFEYTSLSRQELDSHLQTLDVKTNCLQVEDHASCFVVLEMYWALKLMTSNQRNASSQNISLWLVALHASPVFQPSSSELEVSATELAKRFASTISVLQKARLLVFASLIAAHLRSTFDLFVASCVSMPPGVAGNVYREFSWWLDIVQSLRCSLADNRVTAIDHTELKVLLQRLVNEWCAFAATSSLSFSAESNDLVSAFVGHPLLSVPAADVSVSLPYGTRKLMLLKMFAEPQDTNSLFANHVVDNYNILINNAELTVAEKEHLYDLMCDCMILEASRICLIPLNAQHARDNIEWSNESSLARLPGTIGRLVEQYEQYCNLDVIQHSNEVIKVTLRRLLSNALGSAICHDVDIHVMDNQLSSINRWVDASDHNGESGFLNKEDILLVLLQRSGLNQLDSYCTADRCQRFPWLRPYKELESTNGDELHHFSFMLQSFDLADLSWFGIGVSQLSDDAKHQSILLARKLHERYAKICVDLQQANNFKAAICQHFENHFSDVPTEQRFFKMCLFLASYYQLRERNMLDSCSSLLDVLHDESVREKLDLTDDELKLFECMLYHGPLTTTAPVPFDTRFRLPAAECPWEHFDCQSPNSRMVVDAPDDGRVDDLVYIMQRPRTEHLEPMQIALQRSAMNLIALVLGLPARSHHLWYFLYQPGELHKTFVVGFQYSQAVMASGIHYDCGTDFADNGAQTGDRPARGSMTLHQRYTCLHHCYVALGINSLCFPRSHKDIHGPVMSGWLNIRSWCNATITMTHSFLENMGLIANEDRDLHLAHCLEEMFFTIQLKSQEGQQLAGKFATQDDLERYEHLMVRDLQTSVLSIRNKRKARYMLTQQLKASLLQRSDNTAVANSRSEFCALVTAESQQYPILASFVSGASRFDNMSGVLDHLSFYRWLKRNFENLLPEAEAKVVGIERMLNILAARPQQRVEAEHAKKLYDRSKATYMALFREMGGRFNVVCELERADQATMSNLEEGGSEGAAIMTFLSTSYSHDENDCLYHQMRLLLTRQHDMIRLVKEQAATSPIIHQHYEGGNVIQIDHVCSSDLVLVNTHSMRSWLDKVVVMQSLPSLPDQHSHPMSSDLQALELQLVRQLLSYKPLIELNSRLLEPFKFLVDEVQKDGDEIEEFSTLHWDRLCEELNDLMLRAPFDRTNPALSSLLVLSLRSRTNQYSFNKYSNVIKLCRVIFLHAQQQWSATSTSNLETFLQQPVKASLDFITAHLARGHRDVDRDELETLLAVDASLFDGVRMSELKGMTNLLLERVRRKDYDYSEVSELFHTPLDQMPRDLPNLAREHYQRMSAEQQSHIRQELKVDDELDTELMQEATVIAAMRNLAQHVTPSDFSGYSSSTSIRETLEAMMLYESALLPVTCIPQHILLAHAVAFHQELVTQSATLEAAVTKRRGNKQSDVSLFSSEHQAFRPFEPSSTGSASNTEKEALPQPRVQLPERAAQSLASPLADVVELTIQAGETLSSLLLLNQAACRDFLARDEILSTPDELGLQPAASTAKPAGRRAAQPIIEPQFAFVDVTDAGLSLSLWSLVPNGHQERLELSLNLLSKVAQEPIRLMERLHGPVRLSFVISDLYSPDLKEWRSKAFLLIHRVIELVQRKLSLILEDLSLSCIRRLDELKEALSHLAPDQVPEDLRDDVHAEIERLTQLSSSLKDVIRRTMTRNSIVTVGISDEQYSNGNQRVLIRFVYNGIVLDASVAKIVADKLVHEIAQQYSGVGDHVLSLFPFTKSLVSNPLSSCTHHLDRDVLKCDTFVSNPTHVVMLGFASNSASISSHTDASESAGQHTPFSVHQSHNAPSAIAAVPPPNSLSALDYLTSHRVGSNEARWTITLHNAGYTHLWVIPVLGDGNCLFRAFCVAHSANQLPINESQHMQCRRDVSDFLARPDQADIRHSLTIDHIRGAPRDPTEEERVRWYCQNIRLDAVSGGQPELVALARRWKINITVLNEQDLQQNRAPLVYQPIQPSNVHIQLLRTDNPDAGHYSVLTEAPTVDLLTQQSELARQQRSARGSVSAADIVAGCIDPVFVRRPRAPEPVALSKPSTTVDHSDVSGTVTTTWYWLGQYDEDGKEVEIGSSRMSKNVAVKSPGHKVDESSIEDDWSTVSAADAHEPAIDDAKHATPISSSSDEDDDGVLVMNPPATDSARVESLFLTPSSDLDHIPLSMDDTTAAASTSSNDLLEQLQSLLVPVPIDFTELIQQTSTDEYQAKDVSVADPVSSETAQLDKPAVLPHLPVSPDPTPVNEPADQPAASNSDWHTWEYEQCVHWLSEQHFDTSELKEHWAAVLLELADDNIADNLLIAECLVLDHLPSLDSAGRWSFLSALYRLNCVPLVVNNFDADQLILLLQYLKPVTPGANDAYWEKLVGLAQLHTWTGSSFLNLKVHNLMKNGITGASATSLLKLIKQINSTNSNM